MVPLPPHGNQSCAEGEDQEGNDFNDCSGIDWLFFPPQDQKQSRRQCAGGGFCRERETITQQRCEVENWPSSSVRIDKSDPPQQGKQKEESHQKVLQFGNPRD